MLHEQVLQFLSGPRFAALSYADPSGRPVLVRAVGWQFDTGGSDLTFVCRPDMLAHVPEEGITLRVAVVLAYAERFEAIQLKGTARTRRATDAEVEHSAHMLAALGELVQGVSGVSADLYRRVLTDDGIAFDFVADDAFFASPGPRAGARIGGGS